MLVYGDHSEHAAPRARLAAIGNRLAEVSCMPGGSARHAAIVAAFVEAGQLLQGIADVAFHDGGCDGRSEAAEHLSAFVHALAHCVLRSWDSGFSDLGMLPRPPQKMGRPASVELRTPEGFAFYAVYPEAYIEAARRLELRAPPRVIGIRSIGTTLGAAVAAALDAPAAVTVRPFGEPHARQIAIANERERELLSEERHFVVVDEGPGQSGSSFGAVADWLQDRGVPLERVAFVTSHASPPGSQASERQRRRWALVQRASGDFGGSLAKLVERWVTHALGPFDGPLVEISAGEWRAHIGMRERDRPAVVPAWERRKFIAYSAGERMLVKFAGIGRHGECKLTMARALHAARFTAEPLALVHGFLVERWLDGASPLRAEDRPIASLARYIGARARLFPAGQRSGASLAQLLEMAQRNVSLALGAGLAEQLDGWRARIDALERRVVRVCTDNKLDRHEWLRLADGKLIKTDALDHHCGHDLVGCQDIAWDVAGAISEFALADDEARELIVQTERASGRAVDRELLQFCRVAYAAFRVGQARLAAESFADASAARDRLGACARRYAAELQHLLHERTRSATQPDSLVGWRAERTGWGTTPR